MKIIHWALGRLILLIDRCTRPAGIQRAADEQANIDAETARLTLYQYLACPFCVKVRRAMRRASLHIETRDAKRCERSKSELLAGGGALKVPCLKIEDATGKVSWMYESAEIVQYLEERFVETKQAA